MRISAKMSSRNVKLLHRRLLVQLEARPNIQTPQLVLNFICVRYRGKKDYQWQIFVWSRFGDFVCYRDKV